MGGRWPGLWLACVAALACTPGSLTAGPAEDPRVPDDAAVTEAGADGPLAGDADPADGGPAVDHA
ncbi:MAG: hypothetical protein KC613_11565, partial [Myxococcales bacterium]|nr:hypothetical protein [Myxococcales bacterium]